MALSANSIPIGLCSFLFGILPFWLILGRTSRLPTSELQTWWTILRCANHESGLGQTLQSAMSKYHANQSWPWSEVKLPSAFIHILGQKVKRYRGSAIHALYTWQRVRESKFSLKKVILEAVRFFLEIILGGRFFLISFQYVCKIFSWYYSRL